MTNKIATKQYCNTLQPGSYTGDLTRCPNNVDLLDNGFKVSGIYGPDQLVKESDVQSGINFINVRVYNDNGQTTIEATPTFTDIPQSTIDTMSITLIFSSGLQVLLQNYAWDDTRKCWLQYSWKSPDQYGILNTSLSSISVTSDSKYKYQLAEQKKEVVLFQFVVQNMTLYMAFNKKVQLNEFITIRTSIGDFKVVGMEWYSHTTFPVALGFDVSTIEVLEIPETVTHEYKQGDFTPKTVTLSTTATSEAHFHGNVTMETSNSSQTSGSPGMALIVDPRDIDTSVTMTYNSSPAGHKWTVRNNKTGNSYTLADGKRTSVGVASEDTLFVFTNWQ